MNIAKPESCERLSEAEFEVHTGADEIFSQSDADGNWRTARSDQAGRCRAVHSTITEIDIEIFDLGGPIIGEGPLDAGSSGRRIARVIDDLEAEKARTPGCVKTKCSAIVPHELLQWRWKVTDLDLPEKLRDQIARELAKKNP